MNQEENNNQSIQKPLIIIGKPNVYIVKTKDYVDIQSLAEITAFDNQNNNLSDRITVYTNNINFDQPGKYKVEVSVLDYNNNQAVAYFNLYIVNSKSELPPDWRRNLPTKKHIWPWIILILLLLIGGLIFINHQNNVASQNSATESSLSAANNQNNSLKESLANEKNNNSALVDIIKDLEKAVQSYSSSKDQDSFNNSLNDIQNEINSLKQDSSNQSSIVTTLIDKIQTLINSLKNSQSAEQAEQSLQDSGINGILAKLNDLLSKL